jgi:predicted nucleic acid-binding protein
LISTVTEGEALGLARHLRYSAANLQVVRDLLAQFVRVEAGDPQIVEAHAELFVAMRRQKQNTGQNDLWIAATARVAGAELITTDADFLWMHPSLIVVHHIPRTP